MGRGHGNHPGAAALGTARRPGSGAWYHGTSARAAERIRANGFRGHEVFLTTARNEAEGYSGGGVVLTVTADLVNPLKLAVGEGGSIPEQLEQRGVPFAAQGGSLSAQTVAAIRAAGHDALIISYPAENSDPSDPMPARQIARVYDPAVLTVS